MMTLASVPAICLNSSRTGELWNHEAVMLLYAFSSDASSRTMRDSVRACESISMKLMTMTLRSLFKSDLNLSTNFSESVELLSLLYEKLFFFLYLSNCVCINGPSLRFLPSSSSSSTHRSGNISAICSGIRPENIALRAY